LILKAEFFPKNIKSNKNLINLSVYISDNKTNKFVTVILFLHPQIPHYLFPGELGPYQINSLQSPEMFQYSFSRKYIKSPDIVVYQGFMFKSQLLRPRFTLFRGARQGSPSRPDPEYSRRDSRDPTVAIIKPAKDAGIVVNPSLLHFTAEGKEGHFAGFLADLYFLVTNNCCITCA
jgi:hypothetical protein